MFFFSSILTFCLAFLFISIATLVVRSPGNSRQSSESMQSFWALGFTAAVTIALVLCFEALQRLPLSMVELALAALTVFLTALGYRLLNIRRRLASYAEGSSESNIISLEDRVSAQQQPGDIQEDLETRVEKAA